jgi:chorismate mutase
MSDPTTEIDGLLGYLSLCVADRYVLMPKRVASDYYAALTALVAERDALAAEIAALKAQRDEAFKSAINAALRADDHNADPLAKMWAALAEYQPQADRDGHGESWRRMCAERTEAAAEEAANCVREMSEWDAAWAVARIAKWAGDAVAAIRRAKEAKP